MILVAGGGPAGAAAACRLAQDGQDVLLLERTRAPQHKVCGEFISIEARRHLTATGLDPMQLGAQPIARVRLVRGGAITEAALPFAACSLTRRVLDEALLTHAAACGARVRRGAAVRAVQTGTLELEGGEVLHGSALLLATGKHDLRALRRKPGGSAADQVCFKSYFRLAAAPRRALAEHVEIMLFRDGYAGLQLVEGELANLCLLTTQARLRAAGGTWPGLLRDLTQESAHLRGRLAGATECLARPLAIARVPYGFLHHAATDDLPGVFRLGDQMAVIPSFTGDGMAMALHSAAQAAAAIRAGETAAQFHRRLRRDLTPQMRVAGALTSIGARPQGQALMLAATWLWPGLLRVIARRTRVPEALAT